MSFNRLRIPTLLLLTVFSCHAADTKAPAKVRSENQKICAPVAKALGLRHASRSPSYVDPLYVDTVEGDGRESIFQNVDLDGDGKSDDVKRDCGSPSEGSCTLYVALSRGGGYELQEEPFAVIRFHSRYYIVVGDTFPEPNKHRRLHALTKSGAELVCKSF